MDNILSYQLDTFPLEMLGQRGFFRLATCHYRLKDSAKSYWIDAQSGKRESRIIILFIGQTGSGKSTAINKLLNIDIFETNPVASCTKSIDFVDFDVDGSGRSYISFCDMPGIGESPEEDKKYFSWYLEMIEMAACIVYVVKSDGRAWAPDLDAMEVLCSKANLSKFVFALSQVDKVEPFREWDDTKKRPGVNQSKNILLQKHNLHSQFKLKDTPIIPCSTNEGYHIEALRNAIQEVIFNNFE